MHYTIHFVFKYLGNVIIILITYYYYYGSVCIILCLPYNGGEHDD